MFKRSLNLPKQPSNSFFLWGARQTGKSTLLRQIYPNAIWIDLLKTDEFRRYVTNPEFLREELLAKKDNKLVIIDEIQKVPQLLDEIHWLIENNNNCFALCGSSARKVRRGYANLLGGRAIRYELLGSTSMELANDFALDRMVFRGWINRYQYVIF